MSIVASAARAVWSPYLLNYTAGYTLQAHGVDEAVRDAVVGYLGSSHHALEFTVSGWKYALVRRGLGGQARTGTP